MQFFDTSMHELFGVCVGQTRLTRCEAVVAGLAAHWPNQRR